MAFVLAAVNDIAFVLRRARKKPALSVIPILLLASAIALSSTIFSLVDHVLFRSLPFPDAHRLVTIYAVHPDQQSNPAAEATWNRGGISWEGWRSLQTTGIFDELGAFTPARPMWGYPAKDVVEAWYASTSLFAVLGRSVVLGRLFTEDEDRSRHSDAVLITWEAWQRRYGGRADILGQPTTLTVFVGEPQVRIIVGVLAPGLRLWGQAPEFVLPVGQRASGPLQQTPAAYVVGRLKTGISHDVATDVASAIVPRSLTQGRRPVAARIVPLRDEMFGGSIPPAWLLIATTAILIVIACASAGSSFITDIQLRRQEIAVRYALGARPRSLMRQLLVEHSFQAAIAIALGLWATTFLMPVMATIIPAELLWNQPLEINGVVVAAASATVAASMLLCGTVPVFLYTDAAPHRLLSNSKQGATHPHGRRIQRIVAATQLALSLMLLTGATLFAGALGKLSSQPLGFDPTRLVVMDIKTTQFPAVTAANPKWPIFSSWVYIEDLLRKLEGLPGVVHAAGVSSAPLVGAVRATRVVLPNHDAEPLDIQMKAVTPAYFQTMEIRLLSGRGLNGGDRQSSPDETPVRVLVSDALAKTVGNQPIFKQLQSMDSSTAYEIVGVVENTKHRRLGDPDLPAAYVLNATYSAINHILVRTVGDPDTVIPSIRETVHSYDPSTIVIGSRSMEASISNSLAHERFRAVLSVLFGGAALLLACCGVYSLGLRLVDDRRMEIGIRRALGATPFDTVSLFFREAVKLVFPAIAVGLSMAITAGYVLRSFLFGVSEMSPAALAAATVILSLATLIAMIRPLRQAMRVDPSVVLREY